MQLIKFLSRLIIKLIQNYEYSNTLADKRKCRKRIASSKTGLNPTGVQRQLSFSCAAEPYLSWIESLWSNWLDALLDEFVLQQLSDIFFKGLLINIAKKKAPEKGAFNLFN